MLENYVVKIKNVSVDKYKILVNYLTNGNHKNHENTKILNYGPEKNIFIDKLLRKKLKNEYNYAKNAKGGKKLKRIAKSLTFNIPKAYKPTEYETKIIFSKLLQKLSEYFKIYEINLELNDLFANIHYQENTHINMILPMIDNQGKNIRKFNQKAFLTQLKVMFTESVDLVLNKDITSYQEKSEEEKKYIATKKILSDMQKEYEYFLEKNIEEKSRSYIENQIKIIQRNLKNAEESKKFEEKYIQTLLKNQKKVKSNLKNI